MGHQQPPLWSPVAAQHTTVCWLISLSQDRVGTVSHPIIQARRWRPCQEWARPGARPHPSLTSSSPFVVLNPPCVWRSHQTGICEVVLGPRQPVKTPEQGQAGRWVWRLKVQGPHCCELRSRQLRGARPALRDFKASGQTWLG